MTWFVTTANAQEATPAPAPADAAAAPAEAAPPADAHAAVPATPAATHSEVGAPDAHHKGPFPPFDPHTFASQILWFAICFGALYILMQRVIVPRIGAIVDGRANKIAGDIEEAQRLKVESDNALTAYEKALAEAKASAHQIAQSATEAAKSAASAKRADIEAELGTKLQAAEARISEIKTSALADVGAIAHETASAVVHALIGQEPSADEVASAVSSVSAK